MNWTKFLQWHTLPSLTQEEIDNLNNPICIKIDFLVKNLSARKLVVSHGFTNELYKTMKAKHEEERQGASHYLTLELP